MREKKQSKPSSGGTVNSSRSRRKRKPVAVPTPSPAADCSGGSFPVVGIGASAGGLEATIQLLKNLPRTPGMAFVLVQHLDPTHASALSVVLSRATSMPVGEARNNLPLEANRVYVIPPNSLMALAERRLKVT